MHPSDTIAAIATAAGGAARGIVRISGPQALEIASQDFEANDGVALNSFAQPTAVRGQLRIPDLYSPLSATLYCWPNERSYTRQVVVEIHTLGSPPLLECVLQHVLASGARLAEPGEFTLRAFLAGRLDLMQAEAVLGLIDARHEQQFETALSQLAGGLSQPLASLRDELLELLAHLEAGLDFVTEDIQFITPAELDAQLASAAQRVEAIAEQMRSRLESDDLPRVVLYGWPNVGKSSLFNALAGLDHALVSPLAGTTRDYLTAEVSLHGVKCRLIDTAGIEQPLDQSTIAAVAQQMRDQQQSSAHLRILCLDSTRSLNDWERSELASSPPSSRLIVLTKTDSPRALEPLPLDALATSTITHTGLDKLSCQIADSLAHDADSSAVASTAARCRENLRLASESLSRARLQATSGGNEELVAADVRSALDEIGRVVGVIYTDDLLDRIFSRFCIGK